ncbi:hypothetical protein P5673_030645 [Acropora cervicornis]|uniref:Uncharacterized protein n=1 Tax=Acropora cervicornis TaxID=6130 RepID=A0AAD9UT53_ACRCE|nr:hypothetical protein P5673_030645 [Acropora cervicornis]
MEPPAPTKQRSTWALSSPLSDKAAFLNMHEISLSSSKGKQLGVFRRPEDVGITAEYLNPSFLVKKPNGLSLLSLMWARTVSRNHLCFLMLTQPCDSSPSGHTSLSLT